VSSDGLIFVADRPKSPLIVFDGDCAFCNQWVSRWKGITGDRVGYRPAQDVGERYPEIGPKRFAEKVWLIEPDGRATGGAGAILRLYGLAGEKPLLRWAYEESPLFAAAAEWAYGLVARHRKAAATITRCLWGDFAQRPQYRGMRSILLRGMGAVYLMAFWSLAVQVDGLVGRRGILPVGTYLAEMKSLLGTQAYWEFPSLCWFDSSDRFLHFLCYGGIALGALLMAGILPGLCATLLWGFYLSLVIAGQDYLMFQWDALLLEAGLLAILFAPWRPWLERGGRAPSHFVVWLFRWLVFRLIFLSGVVKLSSGDRTWKAWQAMKYHYETQPLPTSTSWYMHQLPTWFHSLSVGFVFWAELLAPVLVFAPRRLRKAGFWTFVLLQILIAATGNYGFFNILTVVLCFSLTEDRDWGVHAAVGPSPHRTNWIYGAMLTIVGPVIVLVTTMEGIDRSSLEVVFPASFERLRRAVAPLHSTNSYGLFAIMTKERPEIIVEGSRDGETWIPYHFRWKPGELDRRPRFTTPHMPRLDWQMWFAALTYDCRTQPWFLRFEQQLLRGSPEVLALLRQNPFPELPPRYIRARLYNYHFTKRGAKDWWIRDETGLYCPPIMLRK
jgi:predicted DCC family thiol-disulfide oxidoreductase YuxK